MMAAIGPMTQVMEWLDSHVLFWPIFIICARVTDVSLGTLRTIFVVRGYRAIAACLGFCEVVIWIVAVSGVLREVTVIKVLSYGLGFALGNACGIGLEQKLALGRQLIIIISRTKSRAVAFALRLADFVVTEVPARGGWGDVAMCLVVVPRRQTSQVVRIAQAVDVDVFVVVEDVREHPSIRRQGPPRTGWRAFLKKK